jgi:hypothetical protein
MFATGTRQRLLLFRLHSKVLAGIKLRTSIRKLMITGALSFAAVSRTLFIVFDPVTFTAGRANPFLLHN